VLKALFELIAAEVAVGIAVIDCAFVVVVLIGVAVSFSVVVVIAIAS